MVCLYEIPLKAIIAKKMKLHVGFITVNQNQFFQSKIIPNGGFVP